MRKFIIAIIIMVSIITIFVGANRTSHYVCGVVHIPDAMVHAELETNLHNPTCDCCGTLWHGGIVYTSSDLCSVRVYSMALFIAIDGTELMLECVDISACICVGECIISSRGFEKPDGNILIVSNGMLYRFIRL